MASSTIAMPQAKQLKPCDVHCFGHLQRVFPLIDRLHDVGCQRDRAGNRQFHFNDYLKLVLLYVWNPLINSIADLQQAAALPAVAKALGVKPFSAGSFSESVRVFDPELLQPIIEELAKDLQSSGPQSIDPRLKELKLALTLVDGTVLRGLTRMVRFAAGIDGRFNTSRDGKPVYGWRLHTQLDLATFSPVRLDRTGARNGGQQREHNVLRRNLQPGRCYVGDGGYSDARLLDGIHDIQSSYVMRTADRGEPVVLEERPLSEQAKEQGVVRDTVVQLSTNHRVRRIELKVQPHPHRTRAGMKQTDKLILYTDLDLEPELIGLIYSHRYTVELFFRTFKQLLGLRHLLSEREEGIDIQIYATVIVCLLIQLISGKKPNKAMRNIVGWYLLGLASEQDVADFLNRPDNAGVKLRAKEALWKKLGV
jgi:hypothetical protein